MSLSPRTARAAVIVAALTTTATALVPALAQAAPAATRVTVVNSCNQSVAPGYVACFSERRTDVPFRARTDFTPHAVSPAASPGGYGPSSLQSAYKLPSTTAGSGQRVYIVDAYDDPNAEADLGAYRTQYGLAACTTANGCFHKLNQSGQTSPLPAGNTGWAGEISLDLDMVSAICPNCAITLVEASSNSLTNLFTAVKEATTLGAKFVSMSWGGGESSGETSYDSSYLAASGVVFTASTGDNAYSGGVSYPASSPRVIAVGGTSLVTATNTRGWSESAWKTSSTEGAGSGCSAYEAKQSWQSVVPATVCSKRAIADVSAVADPATGVAVYQTYGGSGWTIYGGTSAAAPIIASVYALAGTPAATAQPVTFPYAGSAALWDVTSGNTGTCSPAALCTAGAGWDGPTGLGTPNGVAAFTAGGTPPGNTVTVTNPGNQTSAVGASASVQIQATDSGGAALTYSASGLPAGLSIGSTTGLISGATTTAGTSSVTVTAQDSTGASGTAAFTWTVTSGTQSCTPTQLLGNPGFENSSPAPWSASSGVINTDGAHPHSGVGYSWLDGYGTTHTDTLTQTVTIPSGCSATLTYWLWIASNDTSGIAHDKLTLTVRTSSGTSTVQSFSNVNRGSGYVQRSVVLSAFAGQTVTLTWTGIENSSVATSFLIDDTALTTS
jgi:hypothetical protein